jgi:hypothetical protein
MAFFRSPTVTWDGCLAGNSTETVGLEEYLTVTVTMMHEYRHWLRGGCVCVCKGTRFVFLQILQCHSNILCLGRLFTGCIGYSGRSFYHLPRHCTVFSVCGESGAMTFLLPLLSSLYLPVQRSADSPRPRQTSWSRHIKKKTMRASPATTAIDCSVYTTVLLNAIEFTPGTSKV